MYFVYVDMTDQLVPYYAGKGLASRFKRRQRNLKHTNVATKYGFNRFLILTTPDESIAHAKECELIADCQTFHTESELGCNFTRGGEGVSGRAVTATTRKLIGKKVSAAKKGKPAHNKGKPSPLKGTKQLNFGNAWCGKPSWNADQSCPELAQFGNQHRKGKLLLSTQQLLENIEHYLMRVNNGEKRANLASELAMSLSNFNKYLRAHK